MPWEVRQSKDKWCVYKSGESTPIRGGCHDTRAEAIAQLRALYASEKRMHSILAFSDLESTDDPYTYWVQAFKFGKWEHPSYGDIVIDATVGEEFVSNFKNQVYGNEIPYYYEHGLDPAKGMKRSGVIVDMEVREDGIYDKVRFTEPALNEIKNGEWRYISPEYREVWTDPETGNVYYNVRVGGSLTNDAFFKGMAPLNFSELAVTANPNVSSSASTNVSSSTTESTGGNMDQLVLKFAERLGIELAEDATEDDVLRAADELKAVIEPLKKAKAEGEKVRSFREQFPEEYEEMQRLKQAQIARDALAFSENYARFTIRDGDDSSHKSNFGFSQLVMDKIADVHRKFSEKTATHADLKELLDLIGDKGIVDYSERGSARQEENEQETDPILAFSNKISEIMEKDDLSYEKAFEMARAQNADLYAAYKRATPVVR